LFDYQHLSNRPDEKDFGCELMIRISTQKAIGHEREKQKEVN